MSISSKNQQWNQSRLFFKYKLGYETLVYGDTGEVKNIFYLSLSDQKVVNKRLDDLTSFRVSILTYI